MVTRKIALLVCTACCTSIILFAQTVEEYSESFSFPLTVTSAFGAKGNSLAASFFRSVGGISKKGVVTLEWSVNTEAEKGFVSIYSLSGALVGKTALSKTKGVVTFDLSKRSSGVYIASIEFGAYRNNLKLALYK